MLSKLFNGQSTARLPLFFIGHGSPMNAIDDNAYTQVLNALGATVERPRTILVISAHWETEGGTLVTEAVKPPTIHDFRGFPQALFDVQYPAPGSPEVAAFIEDTFQHPAVQGDASSWGLDHGTWSVLRHLYPLADIPVLQLSIAMDQPPDYHFRMGQQLASLREKGILIIGSGNLVHNLRALRFDGPTHDWAVEFDKWTKQKLEARDVPALLHDFHSTAAGKLSVPTTEHYLPLAFVLGAASAKDELQTIFEEMQLGAISMRSVRFG